MKTTDEISNEIVEKQKELKSVQSSQHIVEDRILNLQKEILTLQGKKKELEIIAGKGKYNIRQIVLDIKILTGEYWSTKQG